MAHCSVFLAVDENGDYGVGHDAESAMQHYADSVGDVSGPMRMVALTLDVAPPEVESVSAKIPLGATGAMKLTVG